MRLFKPGEGTGGVPLSDTGIVKHAREVAEFLEAIRKEARGGLGGLALGDDMVRHCGGET
jgi:hypothetical protein